MRRVLRILGTLLIVAGLGTVAWAGLVWQWQDPFTALYTHFQQNRLASSYERRFAAYHPHTSSRQLAAARREVAVEARAYRRSLRPGEAVGRLRIGRIGLDMIVVQGTDHDTLKKGPGHYVGTRLPGEGQLIYVAGHRTTYLAPFSAIDEIRPGDYITFELPYGTFKYRVTGHRVVTADDVSVLRTRGREILRLQACHPRFFASHRYLVDARLVAMIPRGGPAFELTPSALTLPVRAAAAS
jgi:sortase A